MKKLILILTIPFFFSCSVKRQFGSLTYDVFCENGSTKAMLDRIYGKSFVYDIYPEQAIYERKAEDTHRLEYIKSGEVSIFEKDESGTCWHTSLEADHIEYLKDNQHIFEWEYSDETMKVAKVKCKVASATLPNPTDPSLTVWYAPQIPNHWYQLGDLPGMPMRYEYTISGIPVVYEVSSFTDPQIETALPNWNNECDWVFPDVYTMHPSDGTVYGDDYKIFGQTKHPEGKPIPNVELNISRDGLHYSSILTDSMGKFSFYLPLEGVYHLKFGSDLWVPKIVEFNMNSIPDTERTGGFSTALDISLFQNPMGLDYTVLEQPVGKCAFDTSRNAMVFDFEYTDRIMRELERIEGGTPDSETE